jgi:hypothetical protein
MTRNGMSSNGQGGENTDDGRRISGNGRVGHDIEYNLSRTASGDEYKIQREQGFRLGPFFPLDSRLKPALFYRPLEVWLRIILSWTPLEMGREIHSYILESHTIAWSRSP